MCLEHEQQEHKSRYKNTKPVIIIIKKKKKKKNPQIGHRSSTNPKKNSDPLCKKPSPLIIASLLNNED